MIINTKRNSLRENVKGFKRRQNLRRILEYLQKEFVFNYEVSE